MVESSGLLNRRRVKNSTGGSNPPLSASNIQLREGFFGVKLPRYDIALLTSECVSSNAT